MPYLLISGSIQEIEIAWMPRYIEGLYKGFCQYGGSLESFPVAKEFEIEAPEWIVAAASSGSQIIDANTAVFSFFNSTWFETVDVAETPDGFNRSTPVETHTERHLTESRILFADSAVEHDCNVKIINIQNREVSRGVVTIGVPLEMISVSADEVEKVFDGTLQSIGINNVLDPRILYWESDDGYDSMSDYVDFTGCTLAAWCNSVPEDEIEWTEEKLQTLVNFIAEHTWDDNSFDFFKEALDEFASELEDNESLQEGLETLRDFIER